MSNLQAIGIPQFDSLFNGGMPHGSTVLVAGPSGSGKTMFCVHWLFAGFAQSNEQGLYISLTEPVGKLMNHQSKNSFYNEQAVQSNQVQFKDLRTVLENESLDAKKLTKEDIRTIVDAIGNMVLDCGAERVVIDSITALCYRLESADLIRHFIFSLGTTLAYLNATVLLTSEVAGELSSVFGTEEFICDGILRFNYSKSGNRSFRIVKLRGHDYNDAETEFTITQDGLQLYLQAPIDRTYTVGTQRVHTGMTGLDTMTNGGYSIGSSIVISGPAGAGKTITAMHSVQAALQAGQKVCYVSFGQSQTELLAIATSFNWDWNTALTNGALRISTRAPSERYLLAHIQELETSIEKNNWNMVVIDSLSAVVNQYKEGDFFKAYERLSVFCKHKQVTLLGTTNANELVGNDLHNHSYDISTLCDTIVVLKFIEVDSALKIGVWLLKMRGSEHAKSMMELSITSHGALITDGFSGYDGVLSGNAHKVSTGTQDQLQSLFLEEFGAEGEGLFMEQKAVGLTYSDIESFSESLKNANIFTPEEQQNFLQRAKTIVE